MNINNNKKILTAFLMAPVALATILTGCGSDQTVSQAPPTAMPQQAASPIQIVATSLIVASYEQLASSAAALQRSINAMGTTPTAESVEAARRAWRTARTPWEISEAFLFGPVDTEEHDPNLDSWPVDLSDLAKVIDPASGLSTLSPDAVNSLNEGLKGFHVLEYFLFTAGSEEPSNAAATAHFLAQSPRHLAYLAAVADAFHEQTRALLADYQGPEGFAAKLAHPGSANPLYPATVSVLEELVNGMIGIVDESANAKLLEPFTQQDAGLLESRFSGNTLNDVRDNLLGVEKVFNTGVAPFLQPEKPELVDRTRVAIAAYQKAVAAIPAPLRDHLASTGPEVTAAAQAGGALQSILESEVLPAVQSL